MRKTLLVIFLSTTAFVTILIPIYILFLYGESMTGLPFNFYEKGLSHNSSDWSDFGSLLSGLFTLSGSIATLVALAFAIHQNNKLDRDARKRSEDDAKTALKNEVFMQLQKERMAFEKFRLHQLMFSDVLDKLESDYSHNYKFTRRTLLYKNLFRNNSFSNCTTTIHSVENDVGILKKVIASSEFICNQMQSTTYYNSPQVFVSDIEDLKNLLMLRTERPIKNGDITFANKHITLNIIDLQSELNFLNDTIMSLCSFAEFDVNMDLLRNFNHAKMVISLVQLTESFGIAKAMSSSFAYNIKHDVFLTAIVTLHNTFQLDEWNPIYPFFKNANKYIIDALSATNIHNLVTENGFIQFVDKFYTIVIEMTCSAIKHDENLDISSYALAKQVLSLKSITNN